jgi:hypothetical protein
MSYDEQHVGNAYSSEVQSKRQSPLKDITKRLHDYLNMNEDGGLLAEFTFDQRYAM